MTLLKFKAALSALLIGALILANIPGAAIGAGVLSLVGVGPATSGPAPTVLTYITSATEGVNSTGVHNITYSSVNLGTPAADRVIFVGASYRSASSTAANAVSVAGNAATVRVSCMNAAGSGWAQIWSVAVPTGSTGNIVLSFTTNTVATAIGVWTANALQSQVPVATNCSQANPGTASSIATSNGGFAIAVDQNTITTPASVPSVSWSGNLSTTWNTTVGQANNTAPCPTGSGNCILASGGQLATTTGAAISWTATRSLAPFTNTQVNAGATFR